VRNMNDVAGWRFILSGRGALTSLLRIREESR